MNISSICCQCASSPRGIIDLVDELAPEDKAVAPEIGLTESSDLEPVVPEALTAVLALVLAESLAVADADEYSEEATFWPALPDIMPEPCGRHSP